MPRPPCVKQKVSACGFRSAAVLPMIPVMGDTEHLCRHCGSGGFWSGVGRFFRNMARPSRREDRLQYIPIDEIQDNPFQPREYIVEAPHATLRASIEKYGVI